MEANWQGWNVNISWSSKIDGNCAQTQIDNVLVKRQHHGNSNFQPSNKKG